jgi:hypothetical protein
MDRPHAVALQEVHLAQSRICVATADTCLNQPAVRCCVPVGHKRPCESEAYNDVRYGQITDKRSNRASVIRDVSPSTWDNVVELRGFEPLTPSMRTRCATGLRHSPNGGTTLPPVQPRYRPPKISFGCCLMVRRQDQTSESAMPVRRVRGNSGISSVTRRAG